MSVTILYKSPSKIFLHFTALLINNFTFLQQFSFDAFLHNRVILIIESSHDNLSLKAEVQKGGWKMALNAD